jgi:hypothetical protein
MTKPVKIAAMVLGTVLALGLTAHLLVNYVAPLVMKMHGY